MMKSWVSIAALLAGCWLPNLAMGCSCIYSQPAGFIHVNATRLPSNARGALFLPPAQNWYAIAHPADGVVIYGGAPQSLSPSDFAVTANGKPGRLAVEITALNLQRDADSASYERALRFASKETQALFEKHPTPIDWESMLKAGTLVEISAATGLVRVGPVGGFKVGVRYKIEYTGTTNSWTYPAQVEHTIDAASLQTGDAKYGLALDGLAQRRLLNFPASGACSSLEPATVQNFHYVVPDSHKPYQEALLYFSESRAEPPDVAKRGRFKDLHYRSSLCERHHFGEAALGQGAELIAAACGPGAGRASIRGWVGMLEVEDRLRPTELVQVDFDNTNGGSCNGYGMLKQAMASGDARRIEDAVCAANSALGPAPQADDMPSMTDLFALASTGNAQARSCTRGVLAALLTGVPTQPAAFFESYGKLIAADLASSDATVARQASQNLFRLRRSLSDDSSAQKLLEPVLPVLFGAVVSGTPAQSRSASDRIAGLGKSAMPLLPPLLAAAESSGAGAANAAHALVAIIPGDPRLHRILLRNAADPALLASSALDYNRVSGKVDTVKAIALLSEAAHRGTHDAIVALADHGLAARASMPVLIALMGEGGPNGSEAFVALLKVTDGEPEALAAYARAIDAGPGKEIYSFYLDQLAKFKEKGQAFLPAIALRMQRPMSQQRKTSLKTLIESMALPPAQEREWLARLAKVTLNDDPN